MLEIAALVLFGLFVGCYGTLAGIGGGPLIVPVLAMFYHYDTPTLVAVSVLAIFCNTLSGTIAYMREWRVDMSSGTKFGLVAIPGGIASVMAIHWIHMNVFSFLFGFFLLLLALYIYAKPVSADARSSSPFFGGLKQLRRRGRKPRLSFGAEFISEADDEVRKPASRRIVDRQGNTFAYTVDEPLGMAVTALIGALSTFLGIGGGLMQVPALVYILKFPVHIATATSHYITAINSGFTLIALMYSTTLPYKTALSLAAGTIVGAQIGARLSPRFSDKTLLRLLIPVFIVLSVKLMFFNY
ncbi:hypothetical protein NNJEOMEG_00145 [Fundidesulfovibrio magnetotacticus]|uniref:Probable membrane transporter protein n=1 Tax=Fundidesulfovibrio magnetotacticus TaxID=2730080 RepID=A0A6V8LP82_9BACT|nr:sulfite exporter TauE/SafE family protein [Fundidesulfovibrio magnetotacticus]GFK92321.1 hypothetical protein NNJEOMEG_00145 [Fundidesulfovibrio magnetotacticus]